MSISKVSLIKHTKKVVAALVIVGLVSMLAVSAVLAQGTLDQQNIADPGYNFYPLDGGIVYQQSFTPTPGTGTIVSADIELTTWFDRTTTLDVVVSIIKDGVRVASEVLYDITVNAPLPATQVVHVAFAPLYSISTVMPSMVEPAGIENPKLVASRR